MIKRKIVWIVLCLAFFHSCSENDNINDPKVEALEDVVIDVVFFEFTPDTGNNTSRLRYDIQFANSNAIPVKGFYEIVLNADGMLTTTLSSNNSPCYEIDANSECIFSFDEEESLDVAIINSIRLISVSYNIFD